MSPYVCTFDFDMAVKLKFTSNRFYSSKSDTASINLTVNNGQYMFSLRISQNLNRNGIQKWNSEKKFLLGRLSNAISRAYYTTFCGNAMKSQKGQGQFLFQMQSVTLYLESSLH